MAAHSAEARLMALAQKLVPSADLEDDTLEHLQANLGILWENVPRDLLEAQQASLAIERVSMQQQARRELKNFEDMVDHVSAACPRAA